MTRREREKAQHKRLVLESAESVFAGKGYYSATVQEIADQAEFSVGYLYTLFEGKEDVFGQLLSVRADEYIIGLEERLAGVTDPLERVRGIILAKLDFVRRHPRFVQIFTGIPAAEERRPMMLPEAAVRSRTEILERVAAVLAEGIQQGVFINAEPLALVMCVEGITNAVIWQHLHRGQGSLGEDVAEECERIVFNGILAREQS